MSIGKMSNGNYVEWENVNWELCQMGIMLNGKC